MTVNTACTCANRGDQQLLEYLAPVVDRLNDGFSYETDESGEHYDVDGNPTSPYEFICDALDIEVTRSLNGDYRGARICLTIGGPNVWLDTAAHQLQGAWWGSSANFYVKESVREEIDAAVEELTSCM